MTLQEIYQKELKKHLPIETFQVPSRSEKGKYHLVELWGDGKLTCDCMAGQFKHKCYHIIQVLKVAKINNKPSPEEISG